MMYFKIGEVLILLSMKCRYVDEFTDAAFQCFLQYIFIGFKIYINEAGSAFVIEWNTFTQSWNNNILVIADSCQLTGLTNVGNNNIIGDVVKQRLFVFVPDNNS